MEKTPQLDFGSGGYVTPECNILHLRAGCLLCQSGDTEILDARSDWEYIDSWT